MTTSSVVLTLRQTATDNIYTWTNPGGQILELGCGHTNPLGIHDFTAVFRNIPTTQLTVTYARPAAQPYYALRVTGTDDFSNTVGPADGSVTPIDAVAPSVRIAPIVSVDEDETLQLTASINGGTYDTLSYAWAIDTGGGSISGSGLAATYTPDNVSSNQSVTVSVEVTATGTGTRALVNTTDTSSDTEVFRVNAVIVLLGPDLTVDTPIRGTAILTPGKRFILLTLVRNIGDTRSAGTTLRWRRSTNNNITTSDIQIGTDFVAPISPSGFGQETITIPAASTPGTYYYGATVDTVTNESDTGNNNSGALTVTVVAAPVTTDHTVNAGDASWSFRLPRPTVTHVTATAPDLTVDAPTVIPTGDLIPGKRFALLIVVRNQGTAVSPGTTLRWRRSTNNIISVSDPVIGLDTVARIGAGNSANESISISAEATPGTYYYGATVDAVVNESDASNNASGALTINVVAVTTAPTDHVVNAGNASWSFAVPQPSITHTPAPGDPPGTPTNLQVIEQTTTTIALSVSPGSGGTPTNYRWRLSTNNFMSNSDTILNTSGPTVTFTGLQAGTAYWVDVRTENDDGDSSYTPAGSAGLSTATLAAGVAIDHVVNAGNASWAFTIPEPSVTHTTPTKTNHTINAGDVAWSFTIPEPTIVHTSLDVPDFLTYLWTSNGGGVFTDAAQKDTTWTAPEASQEMVVTLSLLVTDSKGLTATDSIDVTVRASTIIRLDSLDALDAVFRRQNRGTTNGAWLQDSGGSTTSTQTGPGTNSAGSYVYSETTGTVDPDIALISTLTMLSTVIASWTGNGRVLALRACIQGNGTYPNDSASGLQVQGRVANTNFWATIDVLEGWGYSNSLTPGATVMDSRGVVQTIVQAGGWVDFEVRIPDNYRQLRIRNIPAMDATEAYRHDAAMWHMELRDGTIPTIDHRVDAGNATWTFAIPQPTITHTVRVTANHVVNAGNVTWTFTVPELITTHTSPIPINHTINVGDIAWSFVVPQPTVTHTPVPTADHTINAGDVVWNFVLPEPSITHIAAPVPDQPTGLVATVTHDSVSLSWDDPSDATITSYQILRRDISDGGSLGVHINSVPAGTSYVDITNVASSNTYSYRIKARNAQGLSPQSGFRNVTTSAAPIPSINHRINAGNAAWNFVVPQPSITHITAVIPDSLTYLWSSNGGGVFANSDQKDTRWTAPDITSDTVTTLTLLVTDSGGLTATDNVAVTVRAPIISVDHTINAGDITWSFAIPQPTVTHVVATPVSPPTQPYTVGAVTEGLRGLGGTTALPIPSHRAGDRLIIMVGHTYSSSPVNSIPPPTGWTVVLEGEAGGVSAVGLAAWSKIGNGSESSVLIPAIPGISRNAIAAIAVAVNGVTGIETVALVKQDSGTDINSRSITPSMSATILRAFVFDDDLPSPSDYASDSNFKGTALGYEDAPAPGNGFSTGFSIQVNVAANRATGTSTWSTNGDSDAGLALTIALLHGTATTPVTVDHVVNAGDVAWIFDLPRPSITHIVPPTIDHVVNAGDISWSFTLPQPTITHVAHITVDHTVDADNVAWTFLVPQPTVTYVQVVITDVLTYLWSSDGGGIFTNVALKDTRWTAPDVTQDTVVTLTLVVTDSGGLTDTDSVDVTVRNTTHVINAGDVLWSFTIPEPTVTHDTLSLSNLNVAGLELEAAALLVASGPGTRVSTIYADSERGGSDAPIEGELGIGSGNTLISRIRRFDTSVILLNDNDEPAALTLSAFFGPGGDGRDLTIYLQTAADGLVSFAVADSYINAGGGFVNFTLPAAGQTLLDNLAVGDKFIFALARAADVSIDHTVDAGDVAWSFIVPEPTVTHITPAAPDFLTYLWSSNAGGVFANSDQKDTTWTASDIMRGTTVTLTLLVTDSKGLTATDSVMVSVKAPTVNIDHVVNAGAVSWEFDLPEPSITHVTPTIPDTLTYLWTSNAGGVFANSGLKDTTWTAPDVSSEIIVTLTLLVTDGGGLTATDNVMITVRAPSTNHIVDADNVAWDFTIPEPSITHITPAGTNHIVNPDDVVWSFDLPEPSITHISTATPDTLTYLWSSNGGGVFTDAALKDTTWRAPNITQETVVTLTLLVTNLRGLTDTASIDVTVVIPQAIRHFYRKVAGNWQTLKLHRNNNGTWSEVKLWYKITGTWVQVSGPVS